MWTAESRALVGDFGAGQALSDEQYALLTPLIPPAKPGGRPRTTDMREVVNASCTTCGAGASGGCSRKSFHPTKPSTIISGLGDAGTGSVSCNSVFVLHLCRFLNQEDLMEREAMLQNP